MLKAPQTEIGPRKATTYSWITDILCLWLELLELDLCRIDADLASIQTLLQDLKAAAASRLGTTFCYVGVAVPDPSMDYQRAVINRALNSIRLRSTFVLQDAFRMALFASNIATSDFTPEEETRTVLAIDYNSSRLSAGLLSDVGGVTDTIRSSYSDELGADQRTQPGHLDSVKAFLENFTERPFPDDYYGDPMPDEIRKVVLFGDVASDPEITQLLKTVLNMELQRGEGFDPAFAPSLGVAAAAFERMDGIDFNVAPAFGCRRLSGLYKGRSEL
jgi:hypothetical protein